MISNQMKNKERGPRKARKVVQPRFFWSKARHYRTIWIN